MLRAFTHQYDEGLKFEWLAIPFTFLIRWSSWQYEIKPPISSTKKTVWASKQSYTHQWESRYSSSRGWQRICLTVMKKKEASFPRVVGTQIQSCVPLSWATKGTRSLLICSIMKPLIKKTNTKQTNRSHIKIIKKRMILKNYYTWKKNLIIIHISSHFPFPKYYSTQYHKIISNYEKGTKSQLLYWVVMRSLHVCFTRYYILMKSPQICKKKLACNYINCSYKQ